MAIGGRVQEGADRARGHAVVGHLGSGGPVGGGFASQRRVRPRRLDEVGEQAGLRLHPHDPAPRPHDRQPDAHGLEQQVRPGSGGHDRGVGHDRAFVGDDADDGIVAHRQRARVEVMADRRPAVGRDQRHRDRQGTGIHPMPVMDEPGTREVAGERRFGLADRGGRVEVVDLDAVPSCPVDRCQRSALLGGVGRHQDLSHGFWVQVEVERGFGGEVEVGSQARFGHRHVRLVLGQYPQALVATRRVGRQVVAFDQGDGCAATCQFEGTRRPDHAASHDHHVGHGAKD